MAIPSNRLAPVTAAAAASINKIAPGRVIVGLGTGYTGRNTMGLPALTMDAFEEYARQVKGLLNGEDVLLREGSRERWIRLIHSKPNSGRDEFFNIEDRIPVMLAANGPRGQKITGEISDGWITTARSASVPDGLPRVMAAAEATGNNFDRFGGEGAKPYVTVLTTSCVLRDGETLSSERVVRNVGPTLLPGHPRDVGTRLWAWLEFGHEQSRTSAGIRPIHPRIWAKIARTPRRATGDTSMFTKGIMCT